MAEDKKNENEIAVIEVTEEYLKDRLYMIRGKRVLLDADLAIIYGYTTKAFNQQVKNNIEKFDEDFMFELSDEEVENLRSKFLTANISSKSRYNPRVFASFVCQMMECESVLLMFVWMVTILLSFFGIILSRYAEKGQAGSYRYYIDEYERDLLLQKITDLEKELTITGDDEQILETKQIVINELIRIRQKKKLKKQKERSSREVMLLFDLY